MRPTIFCCILIIVTALGAMAQADRDRKAKLQFRFEPSSIIVSGWVPDDDAKKDVSLVVNEIFPERLVETNIEVERFIEPFHLGWREDLKEKLTNTKDWKTGLMIFRRDAALGRKRFYDSLKTALVEQVGVKGQVRLIDQKRATLVLLTTYWCAPCFIYYPELEQLTTKYPDDLDIVLLNTESGDDFGLDGRTTSKASHFRLVRLNEKIVQDLDGFIGNQGIPKVILIDRDGYLRVFLGSGSDEINDMKNAVQDLLEKIEK